MTKSCLQFGVLDGLLIFKLLLTGVRLTEF